MERRTGEHDRQEHHEELVTEEYVVIDEAILSEPEEAMCSCIPAAIDSHFHLDHTSKAIWGRDTGHTDEDLLAISTHGPVVSQPIVPVRVVGGIVVYCDPKTYPDSSFSLQGPWESCSRHTSQTILQLYPGSSNEALEATAESASCDFRRMWTGQYRTICGMASEVFLRMLRLSNPSQTLVLHLRGIPGYSLWCRCSWPLFDVDGIARQQRSAYSYPLIHGKGRQRVLAEEVS
jgi:hypothetical protein